MAVHPEPAHTPIQIADDFVRTDSAEIEQIKDDMHRAGWKIVQSCRERGEDV